MIIVSFSESIFEDVCQVAVTLISTSRGGKEHEAVGQITCVERWIKRGCLIISLILTAKGPAIGAEVSLVMSPAGTPLTLSGALTLPLE